MAGIRRAIFGFVGRRDNCQCENWSQTIHFHFDLLWLRGGFPLSFTARSHAASQRWRQDFVRTFLERDIPQLGIAIPSAMLERFWSMLAHYHAQTWNGSELPGRSASPTT